MRDARLRWFMPMHYAGVQCADARCAAARCADARCVYSRCHTLFDEQHVMRLRTTRLHDAPTRKDVLRRNTGLRGCAGMLMRRNSVTPSHRQADAHTRGCAATKIADATTRRRSDTLLRWLTLTFAVADVVLVAAAPAQSAVSIIALLAVRRADMQCKMRHAPCAMRICNAPMRDT